MYIREVGTNVKACNKFGNDSMKMFNILFINATS
jgi:hypothetical protein